MATNGRSKTAMPFVWDIACYCLELPYSAWRHFPAGTYNEQVSTWTGKVELKLVGTAHSAWYMFKKMSPGEWGESERKFAKWMSEKPKVEPTRRLDWIIEALWGASGWGTFVLESMRAKDAK